MPTRKQSHQHLEELVVPSYRSPQWVMGAEIFLSVLGNVIGCLKLKMDLNRHQKENSPLTK